MASQYDNLQKIMNSDTSQYNKEELNVAAKISQMKYEEAKKHLVFVLETLYPGNQSLVKILGKLEKASEEKDNNKKWIKITKDINSSDLMKLLETGIVKMHPEDDTKIALVSFG